MPFVAIINPRSGPGSSSNSTFVSGIESLQTAGITVVGYVPTNYAASSVSAVENNVTNYHSWYHVNGIFFDQMSNNQANVGYYSMVSNYTHSLGMALTIGNPGTSVPASFIGTMNILNIYENSDDPSVSTISSATMGYDRSNFAMIAYNVGAPTQSYLDSLAPYVSYVYFTDENSPNPFAGLTSYLDTLSLELFLIDGPVTSINNLPGDITLGNNDSTITFNTGVSHITISLNLAHANTWTATQTFNTAPESIDIGGYIGLANAADPTIGNHVGIGGSSGVNIKLNAGPGGAVIWAVNANNVFQFSKSSITVFDIPLIPNSNGAGGNGVGSSTNQWQTMSSRAFNEYPSSGTTSIIAQLTNGILNIFHIAGDSSPSSQLGDGFLKFGAGGSSPLSYRIDLCGTAICFDATPSFSPTVFKLSTTGIGNTQGFQSVIAQALTNGGTTTTVSLPVPEPDTSYAISCTTNSNLGAVWVTGKATTQFVINTNTIAGPSSTADCIITHQ